MSDRAAILLMLVVLVSLVGCTTNVSNTDTAAELEEGAAVVQEQAADEQMPAEASSGAESIVGTVYGDGVSLAETTQISAILDDADRYDGQRVRVEGLVTEVCEMRGCWLAIAGDREFEDIRLKVEDGVIVFPMSARGQHVVAEGIVRKMLPGQAQGMHGAEHGEHEGEHEGEGEGEPKRDGSGGGEGMNDPDAVVQLEGIGAVIRDQS